MSGVLPLACARWLRAPESRRVIACLERDGRRARFVGGCVRDTLLDPTLDELDIDIATQEPPDRAQALLGAAGIKVVPTGLAHGTVTAHVGGRSFEITSLRRDLRTDGRRAVVVFTDDFVEDAARRDFTFNAMSCDLDGRLHDPFGGRADLLEGHVRFVGDPRARIREDYLRILRFFRFYARFGVGPPDAAAPEACREERLGLARLSGERVAAELRRLLMAPRAVDSVLLMLQAGVLGELLGTGAGAAHLAHLLQVAPDADAMLRQAALLSGRDAQEVRRAVERLRLSRRDAERLLALTLAPLPPVDLDHAGARRLVYRHGARGAADLLRLAAAVGQAPRSALETGLAELRAGEVAPFPVAGRDVLERGIATGPEVGRLLETLRAWWEAEGFEPDRAACLRQLDRLVAEARPAQPS
jgi:poly(A) polymerase